MKKRGLLTIVILTVAGLCFGHPADDAHFSHDVATEMKPWTDKDFKNDPDNFQFAILTDRTGSPRPGVCPRAVRKLNEMQPEFVITVGDLIKGGKPEGLHDEWNEFKSFIEPFEMPFFYLPGNHDVKNDASDKVWNELFGVRFYSFVYKDVLFLCLNTQEGVDGWSPPNLGAEQVAWAKAELAKHPDVRWTLVFMHQPLWLVEEGIKGVRKGKPFLKRNDTGWPEVEDVLKGRPHTVFAGHVHHYTKYVRNEANYYTLGTTGGGSRLRGTGFGEFDHATWVTMTDEGPRLMNLLIDGMLPDDIHTEAKHDLWRSLYFQEYIEQTYPLKNQPLTLKLESEFQTPISGRLRWLLPVSGNWKIIPQRTGVELKPGEAEEVQFTLSYDGEPQDYFPLPRLETRFYGDEANLYFGMPLDLPIDLKEHTKKFPRRAVCRRTAAAPEIDGALNEALWQGAPSVDHLLPAGDGVHNSAETEVWYRFDDQNLYVAARCHEPALDAVFTKITERDGEVWKDNSIEIFIDGNADRKVYTRVVVNPDGAYYDSRNQNFAWNGKGYEVAAARENEAWTMEMKLPLSDLQINLEKQRHVGMQIIRNRPQAGQTLEWTPFLGHKKIPEMVQMLGEMSFE